MSGLLDRMVQRVRGEAELRSIEPLVRSDRTAAQLGGGLEAVKGNEEGSGAGRRRAGGLRSAQTRGSSGGDAGLDSQLGRHGSEQRSGGLGALSVSRGARNGQPGGNASAGEGGSLGRGTEALPGAERGEDGGPAPGGSELAEEDAGRTGLEISAREFRDQVRDQGRDGKGPRQGLATVESRERDGAVNGKVRSGTANEGVARDGGESERVEVQISIGTVELRSPRPVAGPVAAPAFRPRVTLDEYLRRGGRP